MQFVLISVAYALIISPPIIQSDLISCQEPPSIPFAFLESVSDENYSLDSVATYACEVGYNIRGNQKELKCEKSEADEAAWTQPQFSCIPQSCGHPGFITNGRRIGSLFTFPNSVRYECDEGYKLRGLSRLFCQPGGSWSGNIPVCEVISCEPPNNPENGQVTYTSLEYGSELKYTCDKGFRLSTNDAVFCTSNGKWSVSDVKCIEIVCDVPLQPENGSVRLIDLKNNSRAGSIAIFTCDGDRIADGPTTSKCLETGEWTFPSPKCLEPCAVPHVTDGSIGKYVKQRYRRNMIFQQLPIGTRVNDEEELYIRCFDKYETSEAEKKEEKVSCSRGKWSKELHCKPASCRLDPPSVANSQPVALNRQHGGSVLYLCDIDFKKTRNESVICDFGTWKGTQPICKDTRCFIKDLLFPGLVKGKKSIYKSGESFEIECDSRYRIANMDNPLIRCEEGIWKGPLPPCVAASCTQPPPEIDNGKSEVTSTVHSSVVKYACNDPFILVENSRVQCLFGKWEGDPPKCEDSRCYTRDLRNTANVDIDESPSVTTSGHRLNVVCKGGFSAKHDRAHCLNGKWQQDWSSPCKENDCAVPFINHGDFRREELGDFHWSWSKFTYSREVVYKKITVGTVVEHGTSFMLFCDAGYSFQGTKMGIKGTTCTRGSWFPDPVCLLPGTPFFPKVTVSRFKPSTPSFETTHGRKNTLPETKTEIYIESFTSTKVETTTVDDLRISEKTVKPSSEDEDRQKECYCEYPINDENVVAHVDGERIQYRDKVKNGSVVILRCEHVGFHQFRGLQEIKCDGCRTWHSAEFPTCVEPTRGSAVITFGNKLNVSVEGNLEARKGQNIKLICVAMESNTFPEWIVPSENGVTITRERRERESFGDVLYVSHLQIQNVDSENQGRYGCAVGTSAINFVNLDINDPNLRCPELPEEDGITVTYDDERLIKTTASFTCSKPSQKLTGKTVLTCLKNGTWSDSSPKCIDIKCEELSGNELLFIHYTNGRLIGSTVTFHCFSPGQRSGVSHAKCLENGTWSEATPTCKTPPCSLEDLFSTAPKDVVPDEDNSKETFSYNETVKLTCIGEMIVDGYPKAKCGQSGKWEFQSIECISGCPSPKIAPDSKLILKPEKDEYKLGDIITYSCPPGMHLNSESQLIMCLKYGWSETDLPRCEVNFK